MYISYKQWQEEIERIKAEHGYVYLTKKRCRQMYGWTWSMKRYWQVSSDPKVIKVSFHTPSAESFYKLKWA